jgi:hypothetical protein
VLKRKKEQAIVALLNSRTIAEAAQSVPCGLRTLKTWLRDEEFQREYREARARLLERATTKLLQNCESATDVLCNISKDEEAPPQTRVNASDKIIKRSQDGILLEDVIERVKRLEEQNADT